MNGLLKGVLAASGGAVGLEILRRALSSCLLYTSDAADE